MEIIDARWETPDERDRRVVFFKSKNRADESMNWINNNYKIVIENYREFCLTYLNELREKSIEDHENNIIAVNENNRILDEIKNGLTYYCECGGMMRYIDQYNFAGCENYSNKLVKHKTYNYARYRNQNEGEITIGKNYLNVFKKRYNIPAMTSHIFKVLKSHGCDILNEELNEDYYNTARNASYESKSQEYIIRGILINKFEKYYYQQGVKVFDGKSWHTKIPDYICMGKNNIYVFDAKINISNLNEVQLAEYHQAVKIIAKKSNIDKLINSFFIVYDSQDLAESQLTSLRSFNSVMLDAYEFG